MLFCWRAVLAWSVERWTWNQEGPGSRLVANQRPTCTLRAPGASEICRGCNVLQDPCQKYLWGVPWQSDGLATCLRMKTARPIVSGAAFGLTPRPSAKAQCVARPTLNISHSSILLLAIIYLCPEYFLNNKYFLKLILNEIITNSSVHLITLKYKSFFCWCFLDRTSEFTEMFFPWHPINLSTAYW